jgi:glucose/arabinose dehydrogenase
VLRDTNNDGKADQRFTFLPASAGFCYPHGLAFQGRLSLCRRSARDLALCPTSDGQTSGRASRKKSPARSQDLAPKNGHVTRNIAFGPDGGLYLALGSKDNISDFKPGAQVFKINTDGSMSEFASGIRNPVGIAFQPGTNNLYVVTNERDGLGDDLPPDYMTSVKQGGFYGYPYAYIGKNPDPVLGRQGPGRQGRLDHHAGCAVSRPFRARRAGLLHRVQFPGGIQERRLCLAARVLE